MKITKSVLKEIIREVITEKRLLQAVSGGKVHKFITGKNLKFKGKSYSEIHFETLGVDNRNQIIRLKIIAPKEIFGNEMSLDFRTIRRGAWFKTDTSKVNESSVNESTFVLHYGQGRDRFAHELKAFTLKDALKKFIDIYKIPKNEWDKIVVRKNKWF